MLLLLYIALQSNGVCTQCHIACRAKSIDGQVMNNFSIVWDPLLSVPLVPYHGAVAGESCRLRSSE
jgi:hypothetical protein